MKVRRKAATSVSGVLQKWKLDGTVNLTWKISGVLRPRNWPSAILRFWRAAWGGAAENAAEPPHFLVYPWWDASAREARRPARNPHGCRRLRCAIAANLRCGAPSPPDRHANDALRSAMCVKSETRLPFAVLAARGHHRQRGPPRIACPTGNPTTRMSARGACPANDDHRAATCAVPKLHPQCLLPVARALGHRRRRGRAQTICPTRNTIRARHATEALRTATCATKTIHLPLLLLAGRGRHRYQGRVRIALAS